MKQIATHFPGLNGIRALAAIAVVISHARSGRVDYSGDFSEFVKRPTGLSLAGFGVSIFFVLSGFLITYLLQQERAKGAIKVRKFYMRRILRIWPLYYLFLFAAVLLAVNVGFDVSRTSMLLYVFFAANVSFIIDGGLPLLSHYWSLGVEEQFYLFWPWLNKFCKSILLVSGALIVIFIGSKLFLHVFYPDSVLEKIIHVCRFHCMLIGAVGAILYIEKNATFLKLLNNKRSQLFAWLCMAFVISGHFHIASVLDNEIVSIISLIIIIGQIEVRHRIINMDFSIISYLGKISYCIYIIHPLVIFAIVRKYESYLQGTTGSIIFYTAVVTMTILLSTLSFYFLERPFMLLKQKYQTVRSSM